jgi:hypothetical protein
MELARQKGVVRGSLLYSHLVPVISAIGLSYGWAKFSPQRILQTHPTEFVIGLGFLFAYLVGRIVLARVCKDKFSWFQPLVVALGVGAANAYLGG